MAEYDLTIERKAEPKLYFNLCDSRGRPSRARGAFSMQQFPQLAIKMQQGDTQHSDREPPYASREQLDFSGGRGWDDFEKDKTRFFDSYRAQTWHEGVVILGPEERYAEGIRRGDDVVTNGGFDTDTNWTKGDGWSISGGVATCDGSQTINTNLYQTALVDGRVYRITYTVSNRTAGTVNVYAGFTGPGTARSADGTYTEILECDGNAIIYIQGDSDFAGSIDNVIAEDMTGLIAHWWDDNADADDDIVRVILDGETEYYSVRFQSAGDITINSVEIPIGCEYQNTFFNLVVSIYSDSGSEPNTQLATTGDLQPDVYEHIETFEFTSPVTLTAGSYYHLVMRNYQPAPVDTNDRGYYVIAAADPGSQVVYQSGDGSEWESADDAIFYRLLPENREFDIFPFEHLGCLYMALSFRDGSDPEIYRNGQRGTATSATSTTITDTAASWSADELIGSLIAIYAGKGSDVDRPWRVITDNTATAITVGEAWDENPDETSRYTVVQSDKFEEVLDHGMTGRITDVYTFGNIVYFCRGDFQDIFHMFEDSFAIEAGNRGTFMMAGPDSTDNTVKIYLARSSFPTGVFKSDPEFADNGWDVQDLSFSGAVEVGDANCELNDGSWADVGTPTNNYRSTVSYDGHYSRYVGMDAADEGVGQTIAVTSGGRYRCEAWFKKTAANAVKIEFDGSEVAALATSTGEWTHIYGYGVASSASVTLRILSKGGATGCYYDAVKVTAVDTPLPSGHDKITGMVTAGNPKRLFVMTDSGILKEDDGGFLDVSPGEFQNVRDYRNGAVSNNKGDYIYTTFLNEVIKYYDEEIAVLGPNMDMGLPADRRGSISSLVTYGDWLLAAVDGGVDHNSSILLHNGQGWHEYYRAPAAGLRITRLFIQAVPGEYLDRLWFNEGGDVVWLGIDRNPRYNSNYRYTFAGWIDQAALYGSMGEVEKFFQSIKVTSLTNSSQNYVSVAPRDTDGYSSGGDVPAGESYETLWGVLTGSPVDENAIDGFWSMDTFTQPRLRIHIGLHNTRASKTPDLRSIVIDFIEHVPVNWSYTFRLVTADSRKSLTGEPQYDHIEDDLATLLGYVNSSEPVRIYTPFSYATEIHCKLVSVSQFEPVAHSKRDDREKSMFVLTAVGV